MSPGAREIKAKNKLLGLHQNKKLLNVKETIKTKREPTENGRGHLQMTYPIKG